MLLHQLVFSLLRSNGQNILTFKTEVFQNDDSFINWEVFVLFFIFCGLCRCLFFYLCLFLNLRWEAKVQTSCLSACFICIFFFQKTNFLKINVHSNLSTASVRTWPSSSGSVSLTVVDINFWSRGHLLLLVDPHFSWSYTERCSLSNWSLVFVSLDSSLSYQDSSFALEDFSFFKLWPTSSHDTGVLSKSTLSGVMIIWL